MSSPGVQPPPGAADAAAALPRGTVYGVLLNDRAALEALGEAMHAAPYKAPPKAPVLYLKPRHTWWPAGEPLPLPPELQGYAAGASVAIVIGRSACRVSEAAAPEVVAGLTLAFDFHVPHTSFYRPSVRWRARDASCVIAPWTVPLQALPGLDERVLEIEVDGQRRLQAPLSRMQRGVARLLADVTDFMTLQPGDLLLLGVPHGVPEVRAGQRVAAAVEGMGRLEVELVTEAAR